MVIANPLYATEFKAVAVSKKAAATLRDTLCKRRKEENRK